MSIDKKLHCDSIESFAEMQCGPTCPHFCDACKEMLAEAEEPNSEGSLVPNFFATGIFAFALGFFILSGKLYELLSKVLTPKSTPFIAVMVIVFIVESVLCIITFIHAFKYVFPRKAK